MLVEFLQPEACVDAVIARVGRDLRVATPLAAGKPSHLLNAFYRRAKSDPSLRLTLFTALTLQRPQGKSELERRFLEPIAERVFGTYVELDYELDRVAEKLPDNVRVIEFYFAPGKYLGNSRAQRDYVSSNYTHAARDILDRGVNVLAQQVAPGTAEDGGMLSLSCNPDLTIDLIAGMRRREAEGQPIALVAQTNAELPFMYGDAALEADEFHYLVRNPDLDYTVFGLPKEPISDPEFMIGLYCSALIKDGGELQVGIGALADAIVHALALRHERNPKYREVIDATGMHGKFSNVLDNLGDAGRFEKGLFAASEMVVDGFLHLYQHGVIKRRVYDHVQLQRLLNEGAINEHVSPETLETLRRNAVISDDLSRGDVEFLVHYGVFRSEVVWSEGRIVTGDGHSVCTNLLEPANREAIHTSCLGERLRHGAVIHGGFFLGTQSFYRALRSLPREERELIQMRSVTRINQLYGHEEIDRLHRRDARFLNTCMMVTLSGAAVSDGLESGAVVSGVGGQYNFVEMAHALPDGHSILSLRATRTSKGKVASNIVWSYGHITIPRHLRDVYVTEYGIAYVRGKTDEEVIQSLLCITDTRFQDSLMARAKAAGKLEPNYQIPPEFRRNLPAEISRALSPYKTAGLFPSFPFGCEFTPEELVLGRALRALKARTETVWGLIGVIVGTVINGAVEPEAEPLLARMRLSAPTTLRERVYRRLLCGALKNRMT